MADMIFIKYNAVHGDGQSQKIKVKESIVTFGTVHQVLHPTATPFTLLVIARRAMVALIFMYRLKMKKVIGKKPSTLDQRLIQKEMIKRHSFMPTIRVYIFQVMVALDSEDRIFMCQEKRLMAIGLHQ
jgi:hypothetical protein